MRQLHPTDAWKNNEVARPVRGDLEKSAPRIDYEKSQKEANPYKAQAIGAIVNCFPDVKGQLQRGAPVCICQAAQLTDGGSLLAWTRAEIMRPHAFHAFVKWA